MKMTEVPAKVLKLNNSGKEDGFESEHQDIVEQIDAVQNQIDGVIYDNYFSNFGFINWIILKIIIE